MVTVNDIFNVDKTKFEDLSVALFYEQYHQVPVYREYCDYLGVKDVNGIHDIPFLPIEFFKTRKIIRQGHQASKVFKSSGTTQNIRSHHYVSDLALYTGAFYRIFNEQIVSPEDSIILALLPNYIEQGDSSLVYMVQELIEKTQEELSGFYLNEVERFEKIVKECRHTNKKIVLFGVSYALLDLAEQEIDLSDVLIIETGGMKGRRKEMIRSELHEKLKSGLNVELVYSEYGMTELLSQAYTNGTEYFTSPSWMKIMIRDINDPLSYREDGKTGGVNVIDLANTNSCCFIATDDLGVKNEDSFKILGRFDQSDIRGCNLLVN